MNNWVACSVGATSSLSYIFLGATSWATPSLSYFSDPTLVWRPTSLSNFFSKLPILNSPHAWMNEIRWSEMNEWDVCSLEPPLLLSSELHTSSLHQVFLSATCSLIYFFFERPLLSYFLPWTIFFWATSSLSQALSEPYLFSEPKSSLSCFFR